MPHKSLYGLIGYPLGHSFSRNFFTKKFQSEHINAEYLNFEIPDIGFFMEVIAENPNLRGLNVTIPYKQQIIPYMQSLSPEAEAIWAVNVIEFSGTPNNPIFTGHNTDAPGFALDFGPMIEGRHNLKALVLGTGGASRAVCHALKSLGIEYTLVSRTPSAGKLAYTDLTQEVIHSHLAIINTTPLGMSPNIDSYPPIPYEFITPQHVAYDLVYNPLPTLFLKKCMEQGAAAKGGIGMLHNQAILAWQIWNK